MNDDATNGLLKACADAYIEMPNQMNTLLLPQKFVEYAKRRGLAVSLDELETLERRNLLVPLLRVRRPLVPARDLDDQERRDGDMTYGYISHEHDALAMYRDDGLILYSRLSDYQPWNEYTDSASGVEIVVTYYHPYQILWLSVLLGMCRYEPCISLLEEPVSGLPQSIDWRRERFASFSARVTDPTNPPSFYRLLLLLLRLDGAYLPAIRGYLHMRPDQWSRWRQTIDVLQIISACGLDEERLKKEQFELAASTYFGDPLHTWYVLVRHVSYEKRQKLTDKALFAQDRYEISELLRAVVRDAYGTELPAEDDLSDGGGWKEAWYGMTPLTYHDRHVMRRVVREYGLDPDWRLYWIIEGETEEAFVQTFLHGIGVDAEARGMRLINARGISNVEMRAILADANRREVFVLATLDNDRGADDILARLRGQAFSHRWPEDFESGNFADDELAAAAVAYAQDPGFTLSASEIAAYRDAKLREGRPTPTGKIVETLTRRKIHQYSKREVGRLLALHLLASGTLGRNPPRSIEYVITWARRATQSNYWATMKVLTPQAIDLAAMGDIYEKPDEQ